MAKRLHDIVREEDPTRPTTTAMNCAKPDMPLPAVARRDQPELPGRRHPRHAGVRRDRAHPHPAAVPGLPRRCSRTSDRQQRDRRRRSAAAACTCFRCRRSSSAPVRDGRGGDSKIRQVSAYELHAVDFGSSRGQGLRLASTGIRTSPASSSGRGWDYLGEPTPYYDVAQLLLRHHRPGRLQEGPLLPVPGALAPRLPMAHILPHWTWPERDGQVTPVHVFTSGDEAELFLNGQSLGRKKKGPYEYRLRWDDVVYEPGELEVVAYKDGKQWATDARADGRRAGAARAAAGPRDDPRRRPRPVVRDRARRSTRTGVAAPAREPSRSGSASTVPARSSPPTTATRRASSRSRRPNATPSTALCLAIVRARAGQPGRIRVTATSEGLGAATAVITAAVGEP